MPRLPVRIVLFASSYAPLIALFGVRRRDCTWQLIALEAVAALSVIVLFVLMKVQRGFGDSAISVESWDTKDAETLGYLATYLIPLLAIDLSDFDDVLALGVFAFVLGIVYCNSSLIYTNPMLNLFGYHVFTVKETNGPAWTVVGQRRTIPDATITTTRVGDTMIRIEK